MDTGNKTESYPVPAPPAAASDEKVYYPKLTLNEEAAAAFQKECPCDKDCVVEFKVRARVCSMNVGDYVNSLTFEVTEINDVEKVEDDDDEEGDGSVAGMMIRNVKRRSEY